MELFWELIGVAAAFMTSTGFIPQIVKGFKSKRMDDVSSHMVLVLMTGTFLWLIYGLYLNNAIIVVANLFGVTALSITLALKIRYSRAA